MRGKKKVSSRLFSKFEVYIGKRAQEMEEKGS